MSSPTPLRDELRRRLTRARVDRDREVAAALRSAIAALENAEAVAAAAPGDPGAGSGSAHVAGSVAFGASGEVARRELSAKEEQAILLAEEQALRETAGHYDADARPAEASAARRAADVLAEVARG